MIWWITLGGFLMGCVVAYAVFQSVQDKHDDQDND
jgi:surfactin synthase thioesterase subunit